MSMLNLIVTAIMFLCSSTVKAVDIKISPEVVKIVNVKRAILTSEGPQVYLPPSLRFSIELSNIEDNYEINKILLIIKYTNNSIEKINSLVIDPMVHIVQIENNGFSALIQPKVKWPDLIKQKSLSIPEDGLVFQVGSLVPEGEVDLNWQGTLNINSIKLSIELKQDKKIRKVSKTIQYKM